VDKPVPKPATFVGSSLDDLRDFPKSARRETGFQLDKVQNGEDADDWKPMLTVVVACMKSACEMRPVHFG
jgi:phage-related protein